MTAQQQLWGYSLTALGATLFSTKAIFIKLAFRDEVNATLMLAWRMIFAMPVFLLIGIWMLGRMRGEGKAMPSVRFFGFSALTGFIGYGLSAYLDFKGLEFISAQLERLVLFTYPLFVMFIGAAWFKQPIKQYGLIACAVTYLGLGIVFGVDLPVGGWATIVGTLLVLGCAITFAVQQLMAKSLIAVAGSVIFTAISMFSGGVFCVVMHAILDGDFRASAHFLWLAFGCAILATVVPVFCINGGLARISAQAVAMISTLSPIVTIALAVWILDEPFTWADAVGSALVLGGVAYFTWADSKSKQPQVIEEV